VRTIKKKGEKKKNPVTPPSLHTLILLTLLQTTGLPNQASSTPNWPATSLQTLHLQEIPQLQSPNSDWRVEKTQTLKNLEGKPHRLLLFTHKKTQKTYAAWEDHISDTQTGTLFDPNNPKQEGEPLGSIQDGRIEILGIPPPIPTPQTTSPPIIQGVVGQPLSHQIQTKPPTQKHQLFRITPPQGSWKERNSPPPGLTFDKQTGNLFGTPTEAGTYHYSVTSTQLKKNIFQTQTHSTLTLQINPGKIPLDKEYPPQEYHPRKPHP
jgi:hypothetical protein